MSLYYVTELCFTGQFDQPVFVRLSESERILTEDEIECGMVERIELYRLYSYQLYSTGFGPDIEAEIIETTFRLNDDNSKTMIKQISCKVI